MYCEAYHAKEGDENVAQSSLPGPIGEISDGDSEDGSTSIRGNRHKLSFSGGVTQLLDNRGEKEGESVERHRGTHVDCETLRVSIY